MATVLEALHLFEYGGAWKWQRVVSKVKTALTQEERFSQRENLLTSVSRTARPGYDKRYAAKRPAAKAGHMHEGLRIGAEARAVHDRLYRALQKRQMRLTSPMQMTACEERLPFAMPRREAAVPAGGAAAACPVAASHTPGGGALARPGMEDRPYGVAGDSVPRAGEELPLHPAPPLYRGEREAPETADREPGAMEYRLGRDKAAAIDYDEVYQCIGRRLDEAIECSAERV